MRFGKSIFFKLICITIWACYFYSCSASATKGTIVELEQLKPFASEDRYVIAVIPFQFKGEQEKYSKLSDKLIDLTVVELFNTQRFRIVERGRVDALLEEVKLSQMGITENKLATQIGKQVGAEMVLLGTLSAIKPIKKKDSVGFAWIEALGFEVNLQGRLIDISKGEIVGVGQATGIEVQKEKMAMGAKTGSTAPEETLLNKALEKAVKILVNELASNIAPKRKT